jgi:secreted PhoX family phosphatase
MKLTPKYSVAISALTLVVLNTTSCSKKDSAPPPRTSAVGLTTTFAGNGTPGAFDGTGTAAMFDNPGGVAVDAAGNIYVADSGNNLIRKITPNGVVSTIAGNGSKGSSNGTGTASSFNNPYGIAIDMAGNLYVADNGNNLIREITPDSVVTTYAGSSSMGAANGPAATATFNGPFGIAVDKAGNVYVGDSGNNLIRIITPAGMVNTFAGSGSVGLANGSGAAASFSNPQGLVLDAAGNLYVADEGNHLIREISPSGSVTTFAGSGATGAANGSLTAASFNEPDALTFDSSGNMYITDDGNNLVRKITPAGIVSTIAGSGSAGFVNGIGSGVCFDSPYGIAVAGSGNAYIADYGNDVIRKIQLTQ